MEINKLYKNIQLNKEINGLAIDSRKVKNSYIFFCIQGLTVDGHDYIDTAVKNGACVIVHSKPVEEIKDIIYIKVDDVNAELNRISNIFYDFPSDKLDVYAVTGTNGKTTTAYIIENILSNFEASAYNGTIGTKINGIFSAGNHMTTPDNIAITNTLNDIVKAGCSSVALEISSHALCQHRADNINVDVAIYTNLSHEHLDYHKTMDEYKKAKLNLFAMLRPSSIAILNRDDAYFENFKNACNCKVLTYGKDENADYYFYDINLSPTETRFKLSINSKVYCVKTNLVAEINIYNLVAAIAAIHSMGKNINDIIQFCSNIPFNIGRFQTIPSKHRNIIVDFAHTPDGFKKIYEFASAIKGNNEIITIIGSAGRRDKTKRPMLGEFSDIYCDKIIICEEDCRDESPLKIAEDISLGIKNKDKIKVIVNRYEAIKYAIETANKDDIILILTKGTDRYLAKPNGDEFWMGDDIACTKILDELFNKN